MPKLISSSDLSGPSFCFLSFTFKIGEKFVDEGPHRKSWMLRGHQEEHSVNPSVEHKTSKQSPRIDTDDFAVGMTTVPTIHEQSWKCTLILLRLRSIRTSLTSEYCAVDNISLPNPRFNSEANDIADPLKLTLGLLVLLSLTFKIFLQSGRE
ncbi:hypothetical protein RHMOL_Rhmol10G0164700 [Rhododendron molle]|uniref:Uncharacterized protein n=1 Tax=Rhododendron molle TaxID=49168 RepID=A0ACC0M343_RHOML|nr:hypothetical protein RHMOL_Rhmol10G0164700 [Rhododendron molle]